MTPTESEFNKTLVRRWLAFGETGFTGAFEEFIASDYVGHLSGRMMDFDELVQSERASAAAFSETRYEIDDLLTDGDRVVLRVTTRAVQTGVFLGIPSSGKKVCFTGIVIYRIERGRIAESWGEVDFAGLWRQLTAGV